ncbi:heat-shock protein Hsp20 [Mycobacterium sp. ACS1612]|uniref:Hsp20/alpha crystallin family protein n=1 Tax=Mycobacterium sp. ACS1612 TaxID=1834117 RepID=UPI0007FD456F|nr:Hsp20/alpha crystallin family protein [Mycobacterium sp. ACS1612]OBF30974.1 heat-shock protein Hsp20 [Mycobacterium sp. ACS1612]
MNKPAAQRHSRSLLPELSGLLNTLPSFANLRPLLDGRVLRIEDERKDGVYEVRAELPGVDPVEDIEITVHDGRLTIRAERRPTGESAGRSEICYGSFTRTVALPAGASEDDITASYDRGILTVSVSLTQERPGQKRVEVIETIPGDDDGQPALKAAEHSEHTEAHQPA